MKKIGKTEEGHILVELSRLELEYYKFLSGLVSSLSEAWAKQLDEELSKEESSGEQLWKKVSEDFELHE